MEGIKIETYVGSDGILKLEIPVQFKDQRLEVFLIMQPLKEPEAVDKRGWPPGFIESTAGSLADDPIEREPQGEYEVRDELE